VAHVPIARQQDNTPTLGSQAKHFGHDGVASELSSRHARPHRSWQRVAVAGVDLALLRRLHLGRDRNAEPRAAIVVSAKTAEYPLCTILAASAFDKFAAIKGTS
jgi:hypothetical protein